MTVIGIAGLGVYLPERAMTAGELAAASGIPEEVIRVKFGLNQKRIADVSGKGETVSMMAAEASRRALQDAGVPPEEVDALIYFGSMHKDYYVWLAAPRIQALLGAHRAYAFEICGTSAGLPFAMKAARSMMLADPSLRHVLLVAASNESMLLDYTNHRARFMFNFGDGAAACLLRRDHPFNVVLESALRTDGRFAEFVRVPAGGSVLPPSHETVERRLHYFDVTDPVQMKAMLDPITLDYFVGVVREAIARSGCHGPDFLIPLHTKRSLFEALLSTLGLAESQAIYLSDYGHLSAADPLLGLYLAREAGRLRNGDVVVLLSAGTGYSWGATVLRWGEVLMVELRIGATASRTKTITRADVEAFAALTGDDNPLHLDEEFARNTRFGRPIAHGMLVAGLISAVLGRILPGPGTIYLRQTLEFLRPVYLGDTVTAVVEVVRIREDKPVITLATRCLNQHGEEVLRGEAVVLAPGGDPRRPADDQRT